MIPSNIQIEDGPVWDFQEAFGFIYLDADERTAPDEKEDAVTSYMGEAGEHRDGRTCDAPFDYTATFLIEAPNRNLDNVNAKIAAFNAAIRETQPDSDLKRKREITFYNLNNKVKIVGFPDIVAVPTEAYMSKVVGAMEYAKVDLKIRVSDPRKCDFCLPVDAPVEKGVRISLASDGNDIYVTLSRQLKADEMLLLLRRGRVRSRDKGKRIRWKSNYRWHVMGHNNNILENGKIKSTILNKCRFRANEPNKPFGVKCDKASGSTYLYSAQKGLAKKITFGCAVYKENNLSRGYIPRRISNVVYFVSHVKINEVNESMETMDISTWFTV